MNHLHPVLVERHLAIIREQNQASGASSFKTDELALWHANQQASSQAESIRTKLEKAPFWHSSQLVLKKSR
jgi:hypothetical protein